MTTLGFTLTTIGFILTLAWGIVLTRVQVKNLTMFKNTPYHINIQVSILFAWTILVLNIVGLCSIVGTTYLALYLAPPTLFVLILFLHYHQYMLKDYYMRKLISEYSKD